MSRSRILALLLIAAYVSIGACGQKGPLTLPQPAEPTATPAGEEEPGDEESDPAE